MIEVRSKGRRPWRFCVHCGFEKKKKATKKAAPKKMAGAKKGAAGNKG